MTHDPEELIFDHFTVSKTADGKWDVLGRGGMGITYRAHDTKLRRIVALKVINPTLLDEEDAYRMFLREARAAANLNHRNVAQVYQVGSEEDKVYYAMEFIQGRSLADVLAQSSDPIDPQTAFDWGFQAAEALAHCNNAAWFLEKK